ncbi:hypothetical protein L9F63_006044, partial [Diploptera punctata]
FSAEECLRRPVFFHGFLLKISQRKVNDDTFQKKGSCKRRSETRIEFCRSVECTAISC